MKPKVYWAGFVDGKMQTGGVRVCVSHDDFESTYRFEDMAYIFLRKRDANKYFDDVRTVEIREVK